MDETIFAMTSISLKPGETLPNEDYVFRMIHVSRRAKRDNMHPNVGSFLPNQNDNNEMSVDYEKYTTPESSLGRFGATYKFNTTTFKNPDEFSVFSLSINFLKELECVRDVIYSPIINTPQIKGIPDNLAHSLVCFTYTPTDDEAPELLLKLHNYAKKNEVSVDRELVDKITQNLRQI